jgi:hypothetical protein
MKIQGDLICEFQRRYGGSMGDTSRFMGHKRRSCGGTWRSRKMKGVTGVTRRSRGGTERFEGYTRDPEEVYGDLGRYKKI